ncbi:MAG: ABC transporter permease [Gammaproteobacteria bacterium]
MNLVFLTTDVLFLGLVAMACGYAAYAHRHEHLNAPWQEVRRNKMGMAAAVILATFLGIGILDSLHFHPKLAEAQTTHGATTNGSTASETSKYSSEVLSVFDALATPMRTQVETTYSAPFAIRAFSKETIELDDGATTRAFPRLKYGGAHLQSQAERAGDLISKSLKGLALGLGLWASALGFLALAIVTVSKRGIAATLRAMFGRTSDTPWRVILLTLGFVAILVGLIITISPYYHILGTDKVGIDVLFQTLKSIRTGLIIGTLTTLVMLPFAMILGITAGYFKGWVDDVIQYLYTTLSSIPGVLLIAAAALILEVYMSRNAESFSSLVARADLRLLALCVILGITSWTGLCRLLRGETLKLREISFVESARAFGVSHATIIARHMVPNVMHIVMISIVLDFSGLVLAEAVLSYINIGVDPTMESWGNMINSARLELAREPLVWWSLAAAFVFMFVLVLAANIFADAVRDAFDPRLRVVHSH